MPTIEQSIELNVPVSLAYNQWTQFERFPEFMEAVTEVCQLDDTHLHWVADVAGYVEEWDAEITEQKPDERIAWKAISGKKNAGVVTFHRLDDQRSKIMLQLDWESDGLIEKVGAALGQDDRQVKDDLARFKALVEHSGESSGAWRGEVEQAP